MRSRGRMSAVLFQFTFLLLYGGTLNTREVVCAVLSSGYPSLTCNCHQVATEFGPHQQVLRYLRRRVLSASATCPRWFAGQVAATEDGCLSIAIPRGLHNASGFPAGAPVAVVSKTGFFRSSLAGPGLGWRACLMEQAQRMINCKCVTYRAYILTLKGA